MKIITTSTKKILKGIFVLLIGQTLMVSISCAQTTDRFVAIEEKLNDLKNDVPGLNEKVDFAISGASLQEFIKTLAESNNLNVSVDPSLNIRVFNNFTNEKVLNILMFLCKEYDLDIRFVGSIMSFSKYIPPSVIEVKVPTKEIKATYNNYSQLIT